MNKNKIKLEQNFNYPEPRRDLSIAEKIHGVPINDPYRWMESQNSDEVHRFIAKQQSITVPYLNSCPIRQQISRNLEKLWSIPYHSCPKKRGDRYYYLKSTGLQNQCKLCYKRSLNDTDADEKVFFDTNALSSDGTISLYLHRFSNDNKLFAYALSRNGSDWMEIRIKDVETGKDYPEILEKIKLSGITWTSDNAGFFYSCYKDQTGTCNGLETTVNKNMKLCYHKVGTNQSEDPVAVEFPDQPYWRMFCPVASQFLIVSVTRNCSKKQRIYYADIQKYSSNLGKLDLKPILSQFDATFDFLGDASGGFFFRTTKNAPNGKVVKIYKASPGESYWDTFVKEDPKRYLQWADILGMEMILLCYIENVRHVLELRPLTGGTREKISMPFGQVLEYAYSWDLHLKELTFVFVSYLIPKRVYKVDLSRPPYIPQILWDAPLPNCFDASQFTISQISYSSKDGTTQIPMTIIHKLNLPRNGSSPCLLHGYGGFLSFIMGPHFSEFRFLFMNSFNGVIALPNIRGGCELGTSWYDGGRCKMKQNSFDDFTGAAKFLISAKYTSADKLAIHGHSNGGLLVAACVNKRPDLFKAAIVEAGILDLARYHKFTLGYGWTSEYGDPEVEEDFRNALSYSPYHNIASPRDPRIQYPSLLITTSEYDDRVPPLHSLKFTAQAQACLGDNKKQTNPILMLFNKKCGHGYGKPTEKHIDDEVNFLCFLAKALNIPPNRKRS